MKILFLNDDFPPNSFGGAGIMTFNIASAMQKKGYNVFVITTTQKKQESNDTEYNGIKIYKIYSDYHERWRNYRSLYNWQTVWRIKKILKKIKPDVIHAHNIHYHLSYYSLKLAKKIGAKVFFTAHDTMLVSSEKFFPPVNSTKFKITVLQNIRNASKRYNPFRNVVIRYYLRYVDKVFAVSRALREFLQQNDIDSELLYNAINIDEWQKPASEKINGFLGRHNIKNKKIILFGGRLSGAKGALQIIKALSIVLKRLANKNAVLLIAGREPQEENKIKMTVKEYNLTRNIIFTGWLERAEMKTAFFASDVCVTPSIYFDPFNLFNIEAMAAGKPVVGTCFGGTPEIVKDNQTGYIVNPLDENMMAEKIYDILSNKERAETFGKNGLARVEENFSLNKQTERLIEFYQKNENIFCRNKRHF